MPEFEAADPTLDPDKTALPAVIARNEAKVKRDFWGKLRSAAGHIPFAEDAVAMYYCAMDRATPTSVRATLLAALAYFIIPTDLVPDFIFGFGFTDDASVIAAALAMVASHITDQHRERARTALKRSETDAHVDAGEPVTG